MFTHASTCSPMRVAFTSVVVTVVAVCRQSKMEDIGLMKFYFDQGYDYKTICEFLSEYHDIQISLRTLKRRFSDLGWRKKNVAHDPACVWNAIVGEIQGPGGRLKGYRWIWHALRSKHGMHVPRDQAARILQDINPGESIERQTRRLSRRRYFAYGPNFSWHIDGEDIACSAIYYNIFLRKCCVISRCTWGQRNNPSSPPCI